MVYCENALGKYFSVPKIASPEARKFFTVKTLWRRYRCLPKIAFPENEKRKHTTAHIKRKNA